MEDRETIRVLEQTLDRLLCWIAAADSRFSTILAIDTAMLGALAALSPAPVEWTVRAAISASLAAILLASSLLFLALSSYPRTSGPRGSMVYFGGIASLEVDQYLRLVREVIPEKYVEDLAAQCHRNAEIAEKKFKWVKRAMGALLLGLVPWAAAIYCLYGVHRDGGR